MFRKKCYSVCLFLAKESPINKFKENKVIKITFKQSFDLYDGIRFSILKCPVKNDHNVDHNYDKKKKRKN